MVVWFYNVSAHSQNPAIAQAHYLIFLPAKKSNHRQFTV